MPRVSRAPRLVHTDREVCCRHSHFQRLQADTQSNLSKPLGSSPFLYEVKRDQVIDWPPTTTKGCTSQSYKSAQGAARDVPASLAQSSSCSKPSAGQPSGVTQLCA